MSTATGTRAWVPAPPGWLEVAALDTDAHADEHWRAMVEPVRDELGDEQAQELYRMLRQLRSTVADAPVSSAGLVLTTVEGEMAVLSFSTVVEHVPSGELNPAALLERGVAGAVESVEDVSFPGGRTGVLARFTTPAVAVAGGEKQPAQRHCLAAVPLPHRPRDLVLVSGSCTTLRDPDLLAMATVSIAAGVAVGSEPPMDPAGLSAVLESFARSRAPGAAGPVR